MVEENYKLHQEQKQVSRHPHTLRAGYFFKNAFETSTWQPKGIKRSQGGQKFSTLASSVPFSHLSCFPSRRTASLAPIPTLAVGPGSVLQSHNTACRNSPYSFQPHYACFSSQTLAICPLNHYCRKVMSAAFYCLQHHLTSALWPK